MARDDDRTRRGNQDRTGAAGPTADSEAFAQQAGSRDDLSHAAEHQIKPDTVRPDAARGSESGTAGASARAAGDADPAAENIPSRDASEAAFRASRGGGERPKPKGEE